MTIELLRNTLLANPDFDDWSSLGAIKAAYHPDFPELVLLNYTHEAMFAGIWNSVEMVCRGLILNRQDASVVAYPFDKFFNYGERFPSQDAWISEVYEKIDGSLGIGYWYAGKWRMASRGSLVGDHALWGQEQLDKADMAGIRTHKTLLFEMIMPPETGLQDNPIVKYDWAGLVNLGSRSLETGYINVPSGFQGRFITPKHYQIADMPELIKLAEQQTNFEGYVVYYTDNTLFKVKTPDYLKQAHLNNHFNQRIVLEAHLKGDKAYFDKLPDDVRPQVQVWLDELNEQTTVYQRKAQNFIEAHLAFLDTRKEQAQVVLSQADKDLQPVIFKMLDSKDTTSLIQKNIVSNLKD